jgi:hypothetical protein
MNIFIEKNLNVSPTFMNWLLVELKNEILANTDPVKLKILNANVQDIFGVNININEAFLFIIKNLKVHELDTGYVISIYKNIKFNGIPIENLYRYITFGTLNIQGYPIISDILNTINIKKYLLKYRLVGVL